MKLWKLMVVKCHFSEKWWNLAMAFQWRPIASHTQVRLEGFPYQTETLNQQVRLQLAIEFHFCWVATKVGFTRSWNTSISQSNQLWQIDCISCGKIHDFNKLNWTKPDLTLLKSTISNNLISSFQIPPTGLCFKVASANNLLTSWVCPHKKTSLWTCPKFICSHIIFKQTSCTSFNRESLSFQCSRVILSLVKGGIGSNSIIFNLWRKARTICLIASPAGDIFSAKCDDSYATNLRPYSQSYQLTESITTSCVDIEMWKTTLSVNKEPEIN